MACDWSSGSGQVARRLRLAGQDARRLRTWLRYLRVNFGRQKYMYVTAMEYQIFYYLCQAKLRFYCLGWTAFSIRVGQVRFFSPGLFFRPSQRLSKRFFITVNTLIWTLLITLDHQIFIKSDGPIFLFFELTWEFLDPLNERGGFF